MIKIFKNISFALSIIKKYNKTYFYLSCILFILLSPIDTIINIYFLKIIIDAIINGANITNVINIVLIMFVATVLYAIITSCYKSYYVPIAKQKIQKELKIEYYNKVKNVDISCYDNPDYFNKSVRIMSESVNRYISVFDSLLELISKLITITTIITIISYLDWKIILFGLAFLVINLMVGIYANKFNYKKSHEIMKDTRKNNYIDRLFYMTEYAKDIRLFPRLSEIVINLFSDSKDNLIKIEKKYCKKSAAIQIIQGIISFGYFCILLGYLSFQTIAGKVTIGSFAALLNAGQSFITQLSSLFSIIPALQQHSMYLNDIMEFYKLEDKIVNINDSKKTINDYSINCNNITFTYPGSSVPSIKNVKFSFPFGKKIAIVGRNGAGKTTLIKLLLRLYDPDEGDIKLGAYNYKQYDIELLRKSFSIVFQDCHIYALSIEDNIKVSSDISISSQEIIDSLKKVNIYNKIVDNNHNLSTNVTREFDDSGIVFSGGELQKIAIARAFANPSMILIFDEPNSSLDPISEYEIFKEIEECSKDKTTIVISHKLSVTKDFDYIYMMEEGCIVEEGTHEDLMKLNGNYADMYIKQAEKYQYKS